jgi:prepilin-type N-terminal cleavage/methylation domain-containing protein
MSPRRAFSLIELLVVIGIMAVLMGLLFPALRNVRLDGQRIKCAAQLHQLGIALVAYSSNFKGALPAWSSWQVAGGGPKGDGTGEDAPGPGWTEELAPYFASPTSGRAGQVYNCPSFPVEYPINYFLAARWSNLSGRQNMSFGDIRLSSQFVLSGDCTGPSLYGVPFGTRIFTTNDCDKDDAVAPALIFFGEPGGRNIHRGGTTCSSAIHMSRWRRNST